MSDSQRGWIYLWILSLMLIVIGIQGSWGVALAILFCPKYVDLQE